MPDDQTNQTSTPQCSINVANCGSTEIAANAVVTGVPFKAGEQLQAEDLVVHSPDGTPLPTAGRPLLLHPDGSIRWALLCFQAAKNGEYSLGRGKPPEPENPVTCEADGDALTLSNNLLKLKLSRTGPGPIASMEAYGRSIMPEADELRLCVDMADTTHEPAREMTILEQSAIRTRVRIEGGHYHVNGTRRLSYHLDVELWANSPSVRLDYQFFHCEPNRPTIEVNRIALRCNLALDEKQTKHHFLQLQHGLFTEPREVVTADKIAIITDNAMNRPRVEDHHMLHDDTDYPPYLDPPMVAAGDWLGLGDDKTWVYLHGQDMFQMQPKRIASEHRRLSFELWPLRSTPLALRQGRSRRQVMTLTFADGERPTAEWVQSKMKDPLWEGRACINQAWLAHCDAFEQAHVLPHGKHGRFEQFFARTMKLKTPADMFDLGDTPDAGYQTSHGALGFLRQPMLPDAPQVPRIMTADGVLAPWMLLDLYEQTWTNNEYDGIHCFASELMRTGRHNLWPLLRWMVRHNIEVDFLHYSDHKWLHRQTPQHSSFHTSSGAFPSHFWTQGLLEYYCLTGDPDVLEVSVALGDAIILHFNDPQRSKFYAGWDREVGWALLALVHLYDITREKRFEAEIERLVDFFTRYKRPDAGPNEGPFEPLFVDRFYFQLNIIEGIDLYQKLTGRDDLNDWLIRTVETIRKQVIRNYSEGLHGYSTPAAMAIAYERTGDAKFLRAGLIPLEELVNDMVWWNQAPPQVKPVAILYRMFVRFLGHAYREGMLDRFEFQTLLEARQDD